VGGRKLDGSLARAGEMIGGLIAPGIGGRIGRAAGMAGQYLYNYVSGSGGYTISRNSLMGVTNVPSFGETVIRLRAREYLTDINGSIDFKNRKFIINPGNVKTFPWLSSVAVKFQQYELHGLIFEFVSTSSNALSSTNTALGKVIMATSYNVSAADFSDVKSALITQFANMGKPADNLIHAVECKRSSSTLDNLFVRSSTADVVDPKFYDFGSFQLMTEGMQAVADIGGLWVSYDVSLFKPTLQFNGGEIPTQTWSLPGWSGSLLSTTFPPSPLEPSLSALLIPVNNVSGFVEFENPVVGNKYRVTVRGTGPNATNTLYTFNSNCMVVSTLFPQASEAITSASGITFSFENEIVSLDTSDFGFVGFPIYSLNTWPNGWTGYLEITQLNDATPFLGYPGPLLSSKEKLESKIGRLAKVRVPASFLPECPDDDPEVKGEVPSSSSSSSSSSTSSSSLTTSTLSSSYPTSAYFMPPVGMSRITPEGRVLARTADRRIHLSAVRSGSRERTGDQVE